MGRDRRPSIKISAVEGFCAWSRLFLCSFVMLDYMGFRFCFDFQRQYQIYFFLSFIIPLSPKTELGRGISMTRSTDYILFDNMFCQQGCGPSGLCRLFYPSLVATLSHLKAACPILPRAQSTVIRTRCCSVIRNDVWERRLLVFFYP
jgi:hypothetical protein